MCFNVLKYTSSLTIRGISSQKNTIASYLSVVLTTEIKAMLSYSNEDVTKEIYN